MRFCQVKKVCDPQHLFWPTAFGKIFSYGLIFILFLDENKSKLGFERSFKLSRNSTMHYQNIILMRLPTSKNKMKIYPQLNNLQNAAGKNKCCRSQTFKLDKNAYLSSALLAKLEIILRHDIKKLVISFTLNSSFLPIRILLNILA